MKKSILFLLLGVVSLLVTSCNTSAYTLINSNTYPGEDVRNYQTFSVMKYDASKLPANISIYDVQNIQRAIANQLSIRGFKEDQSGNGQLAVITSLYSKIDVTTKDAVPYWAPVRPMGPRASMYYSYYDNAQIIDNVSKDGVLVVDLVNSKDQKVVWDAAVSSVIDGSQKKIKDPVEINKASEQLFSKFPIPAPVTTK